MTKTESSRDPASAGARPAEAEALLHPDASDDILALLAQIEQEAVSAPVQGSQQVQVEFGIETLEEFIADAGPESGDALAALGLTEVDPGCGVQATVNGNIAGTTVESASLVGAPGLLAVKIVFGDDESGSAPVF
jgi:hypothetical protein